MRKFRCLVALCTGFVLCGCAGYRLGPTHGLAEGERSVQVMPFVNRTLEPRLGDAVTGALRKELQRDGSYRLATRGAGDLVVSGVITRYHRQEQSFVPEDVVSVRDYRVGLTAQVTAREPATGKVVLDTSVTGYTLMRVGSDLTSSERQALPLAATDLARQITALLADGSW